MDLRFGRSSSSSSSSSSSFAGARREREKGRERVYKRADRSSDFTTTFACEVFLNDDKNNGKRRKKRTKKRGTFDRLFFLVVLSSVKKMVFGFFSMSRFIYFIISSLSSLLLL